MPHQVGSHEDVHGAPRWQRVFDAEALIGEGERRGVSAAPMRGELDELRVRKFRQADQEAARAQRGRRLLGRRRRRRHVTAEFGCSFPACEDSTGFRSQRETLSQ